MPNNRIFYAIQQVAIKGESGSVYFPIHGLQSCGVTTNFNLSQVFEIGQINIYDNIEDIPDVQVTLNKILDGYPPIFVLATQKAATPTLADRSNFRCTANLTIYAETSTSAQGTPLGQMETSGLFVSSVRYNFPRDGNFAEELTLVGNNKVWKGDARIVSADSAYANGLGVTGLFTTVESPIGLGGVNRRQDLLLVTTSGSADVNGACTDPDCTILPAEVAGVNQSGINILSSLTRAHLNSISVSCNLNRESINELGRFAPYVRIPTYPIEVTTEIEITATSGDLVSATESGIYSNSVYSIGSDSGNLKNRTIRVATAEGLRVYVGMKNKLASTNYTGGDAGGGPVNVSYTYRGFNDFTVIHSGEGMLSGLNGVSNSDAITNCTGFWSTGKVWLFT